MLDQRLGASEVLLSHCMICVVEQVACECILMNIFQVFFHYRCG